MREAVCMIYRTKFTVRRSDSSFLFDFSHKFSSKLRTKQLFIRFFTQMACYRDEYRMSDPHLGQNIMVILSNLAIF